MMVFDTWGGVLGHREYLDFLWQYMQIVEGLIRENDGRRVPVTLFTKGGGLWLEAMADTGCDALGLDWTVNLAEGESCRAWWRCKVIWIRQCYMHHHCVLSRKSNKFWQILDRAAVMCLIWGMGSIKMYRKSVRTFLWRLFINILKFIINKSGGFMQKSIHKRLEIYNRLFDLYGMLVRTDVSEFCDVCQVTEQHPQAVKTYHNILNLVWSS